MKDEILLHLRAIMELVDKLPTVDPIIAEKAAKFDAMKELFGAPAAAPAAPLKVKKETKAQREAREFSEQSKAAVPPVVESAETVAYSLAGTLEELGIVAPYPLMKLSLEQMRELLASAPNFEWPEIVKDPEPTTVDAFGDL